METLGILHRSPQRWIPNTVMVIVRILVTLFVIVRVIVSYRVLRWWYVGGGIRITVEQFD